MNKQKKYYVHTILTIIGFTALCTFILGFPFGTMLGSGLGYTIGVLNKENNDED
ncbi:hypothetical protein J3T65_11670 [Staphylococcus simiae]|uniref:hypothetical protein n=1 Tax=Staphylococcus simiae TaxID=308354 RepID=UPI001A957A26|nr:hypothetical protein [Staphylococcus simiae]MBO1202270.1 hypothetical protein [Staphylococcus simiae]MBO1204526.1 hypothetical protein [Staphylococcus simiae]MBO1212064.1 hypothetical protein [Staphylococcus simiae]MBO1230696.1 hypothetical protein [Staphylococcus simiae]QSY54525.1 hypothetical protein J3R86_03530 [Staphylococcus simiae]